MAYVYRHIRLDKNEPFYIGVSNDCDTLHKRAHKKLGRNRYWQNIINKTDYRVEILFDEVDFDFAKQKEIELIKLYGRKDLNNGTLVNLTDGGEGTLNMIITDEHKLKISIANKGSVFPETHRLNLRKSSKNRSEEAIEVQRQRMIYYAKKNKGRKFCSNKCNGEYIKSKKLEHYLNNQSEYCSVQSGIKFLKPHILQEQNNCCSICSIENEWNGKPIVFVLDHIDGDASNNKRENLRLVCPNCDSQLDTYKSKNKNSARKERYLMNKK
jgi:hypothetical protein